MAEGNIDIVVKLIDKASGPLGKLEGAAGKMGSALRTGGLVGIAAVGGLIAVGVNLVQQAAEEEAGINRLAAAIDANGGSWAKSGKQIEAVIKQREKLAFSDDDLRSSLALLTAITGDSDEALRRQTIAMDFSRGAGIDLNTASKLLGKVTDENVNVLGRYGIRVEKGADATELLTKVQAKFSGQSQAFAESTAGRWQRFNIALDNLKETIGAALLPLVSKLAEKLGGWLEDHEEQIGAIVKAWVAFAQNKAFPAIMDFVETVRPHAEKFFKLFTTGLETIYPIAKAVFEFIINNKVALIAAIVAIGAAILLALGPGALAVLALVGIIALVGLIKENWDMIEKTITENINKIVAKIREFPIIGAIVEDTWNTVKTIVETAIKLVILQVEFLFASIQNAFAFFKAIFSGDWNGAWNALKDQAKAIWDLLSGLFGIALDAIKALLGSKLEMVKTIGSDLGNAIVNAASGIWNGIKDKFSDALNTIGTWVTDNISMITGWGLKIGGAIAGGVKSGLNTLIGLLESTMNAIIDGINVAAEALLTGGLIGGLAKKLGIIPKNLISDVPHISLPRLETGGFVAKTGLAVVHEGETFSGVGRGGGEPTIIFNHYGTLMGNEAEAERFAAMIDARLRRKWRRQYA